MVENSKVKVTVCKPASVCVSVFVSVRTKGGERELNVLRTADASYNAEVILCSTHGWYSEKISYLALGHRKRMWYKREHRDAP